MKLQVTTVIVLALAGVTQAAPAGPSTSGVRVSVQIVPVVRAPNATVVQDAAGELAYASSPADSTFVQAPLAQTDWSSSELTQSSQGAATLVTQVITRK